MSETGERRFEIMPFPKGEQQAAALGERTRLTVTSSPRHGVDHTVDFAARIRALGHRVTVHLAVRMIRGRDHLEAILERVSAAGIDDLFVVGGDIAEPHGPYRAAVEVLEILAGHPRRPARLGIGGYPEGHPLIDDGELVASLERKSRYADYLTTQLCFDPQTLLSWLVSTRGRGVTLPAYAGVPGPVDRRRLLEVSLRVGVGPSLRFLRKQGGLVGRLLSRPEHEATRLYEDLAPCVGDPRWGLQGLHLFTFNELVATWEWEREHRPAPR